MESLLVLHKKNKLTLRSLEDRYKNKKIRQVNYNILEEMISKEAENIELEMYKFIEKNDNIDKRYRTILVLITFIYIITCSYFIHELISKK